MENDIVAVDIGTSKICVLITKYNTDDASITVRGTGTAKTAGMIKGVVSDAAECTAAIRQAVAAAEAEAGARIGSAYLNLSGPNATVAESYAEKEIEADDDGLGRITDNDIAALMELAKNVQLCSDEQVVDVIPQKYYADSMSVKGSLQGMTATRAGMKATVVIARIDPVKKLVKCMSAAGIETDGFIMESLALPELMLTRAEIMSGAITLDVGGDLTDVSYISGDRPVFKGTIHAGGNHVIRDLAAGTEVGFADAEHFVRHNIIPLSVDEKTDYELKIRNTAAKTDVPVLLSQASDIIEARVEEIMTLALEMLHRNNIIVKADASVVLLCGRGFQGIEGASELAAKIFSLPVRTVWERHDAATASAFAIARFAARNYAGYDFSSKVVYAQVQNAGFIGKIKKYFNKSNQL